jgi:hypothetical protein
MKSISLKSILTTLVYIHLIISTQNIVSQTCDNLALSFSNANSDYISLSPSPITGSGDFTIEAWFYSNSGGSACPVGFQTLFSLHDPGPSQQTFEFGMCNGGQINFNWYDGINFPLGPIGISTTDYSQSCHHIAVTRMGTQVEVFIDGISISIFSMSNNPLSFTTFQVGRGGTLLNSQDWDGIVDEVRLWNTVRSASQIGDFKDCSLAASTGQIPGLVVYWTFDQTASGVVAGGNNTGAVALDMSGSTPPNDGVLNGFDLTLGNTTSNFICNPCGSIYELSISDQPAQFPVGLLAICEGSYAHFCVTQNGIPINIPLGMTVTWESSDGTIPFTIDQDLIAFPNATNALCFAVAPGVITGNCNSNTTGFTDRIYRAVIKKTMGNQICTYTTSEHPLQICCEVNNAQVNYVVQPPTPFNTTLCEGSATIDVSLSTSHPFLNPLAPGVFIQWCIDGVPQGSLDNMLSFTYTGPVSFPNVCFEAKIQNCICPLYSAKTCIPVDRDPICGTIDAVPFSSNLMPNPAGGQYDYLICPGDDAYVGMLVPTAFQNCNSIWQFSFNPAGPWNDLGASNTIHHTNSLPHTFPPNNSLSPYLWPPGTQTIYYRVECRPLSFPNSGCGNCTSNVVSITLKQPPPPPIITTPSNPICKGSLATLSINPVPGAQIYTWYCNGLFFASGSSLTSIPSDQSACYEVVVSDGCFLVTSSKFCLQVCEIVPIISCPLDNPCACLGVPIRLSGCASYSTCPVGPFPLTYSWTTSNGGPGVTVGCDFIHTPDPSGTDYTLIVNDPNTGCASFKTITIVPCQ